MDLIQTLRSGMQPYSQFNSLFSEENGLPLSMIINEFTFKCCHIRWQTRSLSLIDLEPTSTCILRGEKTLCPSYPVTSFIDRHRHRKVESRMNGKQKVEHLRALPEVASCHVWTVVIPSTGRFYDSSIVKILFEIIVHIIFIVQTRQGIKTIVCLVYGFFHLIKREYSHCG